MPHDGARPASYKLRGPEQCRLYAPIAAPSPLSRTATGARRPATGGLRFRQTSATGRARRGRRLPRLHHVAQHVLQDAAMAEIFDLVERVDAAQQLDRLAAAVGAVDDAGELHARLDAGLGAENIEVLGAGDLQALPRCPAGELQRQHAHADEVRAVDALEALDDHRLDAEETRA